MVQRLKVTFSGSLFAGEAFAFGIHYANNVLTTEATPAVLQEWAENCAGVIQTHESDGLFAAMGATTGVTEVNTLYYPPTGPSVYSGSAPVTSVSGAGTPNRPAQISRVVSLLTGINGRRYRGRVYLPSLVGTINANGQDTPSQASVDAFADFLVDLGTAWPTSSPVAPVVYSEVANAVTAVTSIRVGNVLDTQRRRMANLVETYLSSPVP